MDLTLKINADFEKASKAFKDLANSSEETRTKIEKYSESFQNKNIDSFINKQKLLEASLTGTRGETAAMQQAVNNYNKEIERLIKSGLSPESEAVQRLASEQQKLKDKIKEANEIQKAQADLMKTAQTAAVALYAAIGAGIVAVGAMTQKTAELGNELAKSSQRLGISVEGLQELDYAAKQSGVSNFRNHLDKLNKTMGDVKSGTGSLTKYLKDNDKQLLEQLKNVKSNDEAFMLLMDSVGKAPDEFTKAKLATEYFGKAGNDLIVMANSGTEGIAALREEAQKYGIMSTEAAKNSEAYLDAQTRLKTALSGVSTELTNKLIPGITNTVNKIADFIASVDDWEGILIKVGYALAGITAGLTAFLIITKGAAAIHAVATAFKALTAAMASNPFTVIAVVITAVLIPALIYLFKNWDMVQTYISQGIARLEYAFKWFGSQIKENLIIAFNAIKIAGVTLLDFIYGNIIRGVGQLLIVMGKLPFVGEMFEAASVQVMRLGNAIGNLAEETRQNSRDAIQAAKDEQEATEQVLKNKLESIDEAAKARREELNEKKKEIEEEQQAEQKSVQESEYAITEIKLQSLKERLNEIALTETQALNQVQNEQIEIITQFLKQRADLEGVSGEERIIFLQNLKEQLLSEESEFQNERIAIEKAADEMIKQSQEDLAKRQEEIFNQKINAAKGFLNGFSQLFDVMGEKNRALAIASKSIAMVEAGINTAVAATKSLTAAPYPWNIALMAGTIAAGVAQQVKIVSSMIPSAETGGRFIVPNSTGVDDKLYKFNGGEEINVTPRGMIGQQESFNFNFLFDGRVFAEIINRQARAGELYTLKLAGNL